MQTDEELMKAYQAGSEEAFNALYGKFSSMVYAYAKRRLRANEVDDFYQKVWRHLHEKKNLYQGQTFAPWFFVIIRHLLIDEYRALGRRQEVSSPLVEKLYAATSGDEVAELLQELPPDTRNLVEKYYLEGHSYEDLEKETGLSQANLRQRLSRALRGLRKLYE